MQIKSHFMILNSIRGFVNLSIGLYSHFKIVHGAYYIASNLDVVIVGTYDVFRRLMKTAMGVIWLSPLASN